MSKLILEIQGKLAQEVQEPVNSKSVKCWGLVPLQ